MRCRGGYVAGSEVPSRSARAAAIALSPPSTWSTAGSTKSAVEMHAIFAGCQGVDSGQAPWVPHYAGEPLAVRRHSVAFRSFDPFELLLAIPA